ncbi:Glycosyltransferase involved in cell wall bisynthesis [Bacteroides faecichinchillae]|uniref:Glycosyltransferase involved in cell wall bisynthesis n=1 Tax=Bacteroides faecichinchillae TaxID=871325 RepID=A0A1M5B9I2_9BACE|nr:glycosyltransferase family 2 protein [Bacteroides faecichinchillae]THG67514.1 glycosyltransferase family 2 protein [Bacteroides faecichinchillae]SHF39066.1 Glycosyltransferase involved in cell wall bisynthesis [Bacteroides faecichinchillae]
MNNNQILVTVAIPFYNAEAHLADAIRSVINQTYTNLEILLVDDGSTDRSLAIATSFVDKRIKVISDGGNRGLVYRLNQSVLMSKGEYYARMDADDIMNRQRIEKQLETLKLDSTIDVLGTSYYSIGANNEVHACILMPNIPITSNMYILHPSVMAKRDWFVNNPYNDKFVRIEDKELWMRTLKYSKFRNLQESLMFYREYGIPTCKKYLTTHMSSLRIFVHPIKYDLNWLTAVKNIVFAFAKSIFCLYCHFTNQMDVLVSLRKTNKRYSISFDMQKAMVELDAAIQDKDVWN